MALSLGIGLGATSFALSARADPCDRVMPWDRLPETGSRFVEPAPIIAAVSSLAYPAAFAPTGIDHRLRLVSQRDLGGEPDLEPVSVAAPYVVAGGLLLGFTVTRALGQCRAARPQAAMLQAVALTATAVAALKVAVGRQWPNAGRDPRLPDRLQHPEFARDFKPFGRFGAWPSGHTAAMFSVAAALERSAPELGWPRWLGYPFAAGVALGMWLGDHHWASDILSGALLGQSVGMSVGASFATDSHGLAFDAAWVPRDDGGMLVWAGVW